MHHGRLAAAQSPLSFLLAKHRGSRWGGSGQGAPRAHAAWMLPVCFAAVLLVVSDILQLGPSALLTRPGEHTRGAQQGVVQQGWRGQKGERGEGGESGVRVWVGGKLLNRHVAGNGSHAPESSGAPGAGAKGRNEAQSSIGRAAGMEGPRGADSQHSAQSNIEKRDIANGDGGDAAVVRRGHALPGAGSGEAAPPLSAPTRDDLGSEQHTHTQAAAEQGGAGAAAEVDSSAQAGDEGASGWAGRGAEADGRVDAGVQAQGAFFRGAPWKAEVQAWLRQCWPEKGSGTPIPIVEELPSKQCPSECSGNGVCNHELGECRCRLGYKGPACSDDDLSECNLPQVDDFELGPWLMSTCTGHCDKRTALCFCGPRSRYPQRGIRNPCGYKLSSQGGFDPKKADHEFLYHNQTGFCNLAPDTWTSDEGVRQRVLRRLCEGCHDGFDGPLCSEVVEAYCPLQCSGHGTCHRGYCQCRDGFFGMDCALPSALTPPPLLPSPSDAPGRSLTEIAAEEPSPTVSSSSSAASRRSVTKPRPLIFVYDLPGEFAVHLLEGRKANGNCVPRLYSPGNITRYNSYWLYTMETAVLESLLSSPHRTTNPEEADYFYVPVLGGCATIRSEDSTTTRTEPYLFRRSYFSAAYYDRAQKYISVRLPYWNRTGGRDHIWNFPWDEGACWAPKSIWPGIMLTHWGNTMAKHKGTTTAYGADSWDVIPEAFRGRHPCFDPVKDVVMPAFKEPLDTHLKPRLWLNTFEQRPTLFYFKGNLGSAFGGRPEDKYSMGIRQTVAAFFASTPNKKGQKGSNWAEDVTVSNVGTPNYGKELASSRFCGVFPGDGFSARMEDSILAGCIPVVIQDGIFMAFENYLDHTQFTVRIKEKDIPDMVSILRSIPEQRVRQMLAAVQGVVSRWYYRSFIISESARQEKAKGGRDRWRLVEDSLPGDDATDTLIQILAYKLNHDEWRKKQDGAHVSKDACAGLKSSHVLAL